VTPKYPQVTLALQSSVSRALVNGNVQDELDRAKKRLTDIVG
jgi:multiple sugar transport system substrate-binding protein